METPEAALWELRELEWPPEESSTSAMSCEACGIT